MENKENSKYQISNFPTSLSDSAQVMFSNENKILADILCNWEENVRL